MLSSLWKKYWAVLAYIGITFVTRAFYQADSVMYVRSVLAFEAGDRSQFLEFSHILWRPLGYILHPLFSLLPNWLVGADAYHQVGSAFFSIAWISGLVGVIVLVILLRLLSLREYTIGFMALFLIVSNAFLNFSQTASSYVPGFSFILLALYFSVRSETDPLRRKRSILFASGSLAIAICLWVSYLWSVPGVFIFTLLYFGFTRQRVFRMITIVFLAALIVVSVYGIVMAAYGLDPIEALTAWNAHMRTVIQQTGVSRVVYGIAKVLFNVSTEQVLLLKRYLLHDPFNPVTVATIFWSIGWKHVLFYLMLAAVSGILLRERQTRTVFYSLLVGALPILYFATSFDGAATERYFPLLPFLLLAIACAVNKVRRKSLRIGFLLLVLSMAAVNVYAMYGPRIDRHLELAEQEMQQAASSFQAPTLLFILHYDPIAQFKYELHDHVDYLPELGVVDLIAINALHATQWRSDFARRSDSLWSRGGEIWVRPEVFAQRPPPESEWIEGQDPRISWQEIPAFIQKFDAEPLASGIAMLRLLPTPGNKAVVDSILAAR